MLILIIGLLTAPMAGSCEPPVATEIRAIEFTPVYKKRRKK